LELAIDAGRPGFRAPATPSARTAAGLRRFQINDRAMLDLIPAGLEMELPGLK
jgi:hypothetical protein